MSKADALHKARYAAEMSCRTKPHGRDTPVATRRQRCRSPAATPLPRLHRQRRRQLPLACGREPSALFRASAAAYVLSHPAPHHRHSSDHGGLLAKPTRASCATLLTRCCSARRAGRSVRPALFADRQHAHRHAVQAKRLPQRARHRLRIRLAGCLRPPLRQESGWACGHLLEELERCKRARARACTTRRALQP